MAIVDGSLQLGYKDSAWFTANATLVLLAGQVVYLQQTGTYKLGDGVTQLSALSFLGASSGDMLKSVYDVDNTGVVDNAESIKIIGRNSTGATLRKGTIIYINGSTGNRPNFVKAQANSEATSAGTFGVIADDLLNNTDGYALCLGYLDNLDTRTTATYPFTTDTLVDGDTIYLSPTTAGYITNVKPSAPNHLVYLGKVTRTSPTNGTIVYRVQNGYELDELHDVQDVSYSSPIDADSLLIKDSTNSLWKRLTFANLKTYLTGLYVGLTGNQTVAGQKTFSDNLTYDNGTVSTKLLPVPTIPTYMGMFMNVTPNSTNYSIAKDSSGNTFINGTNVYLSAGASNVARFGFNFTLFTPQNQGSGSAIPFNFSPVNQTNTTASTEVPTIKLSAFNRQFAGGSLTIQRNFWIEPLTISFTSVSTVTDAYGTYLEAPIAGTNATITNNYSLGVNGKSNFLDAVKLNAETANRVLYLDASKNVKSSSVTDTELGYVSGVTSSIQTQLNGKQGPRSINILSASTTTLGSAANTDYYYICNGACTLTMPTAVGNTNLYVIKNITGTDTINTTSSQTIDGSTSISLTTDYQSITLISDGSNWIII